MGLEGQLEGVGLEVTTQGVRLVHVQRAGGREFQILGAETAANEVRTSGTESRLVLESLRERVER